MYAKRQKLNLSDTNIAGIGGEVDKQCRLNAAKTEAEWKGIGSEPGIKIWRIENFHIVAVPPSSYGTFYDGDSYIILKTFKIEDKLHHDVHFWLGRETSQDEAGTAAYKTVELDDFLGGVPTQHREVMGSESTLFQSYFKQLVIAHGGVESGFKHVGPKNYEPRLYRIYGNKAKNLSIKQVPMSYTSLNSGDAFVLDKGLEIFQWHGKENQGMERNKAAQFAQALKSDRGNAVVKVFSQDDSDADIFWEAIGGKGMIAPPLADEESPNTKRLLKVSDSSGSLLVTEVASGKLTRGLLNSDDLFILDAGNAVTVWVGKRASSEEKKRGLQIAVDYVNKNGLPSDTPITRVVEGGDNSTFYSHFE